MAALGGRGVPVKDDGSTCHRSTWRPAHAPLMNDFLSVRTERNTCSPPRFISSGNWKKMKNWKWISRWRSGEQKLGRRPQDLPHACFCSLSQSWNDGGSFPKISWFLSAERLRRWPTRPSLPSTAFPSLCCWLKVAFGWVRWGEIFGFHWLLRIRIRPFLQ